VFAAVFSVFVVAILVLCVLTIRFALRRDRDRRAEQLGRTKK
jgi:Flp pilus assembly protein TadB